MAEINAANIAAAEQAGHITDGNAHLLTSHLQGRADLDALTIRTWEYRLDGLSTARATAAAYRSLVGEQAEAWNASDNN